jgi:hypothetical protein
VFASNNAGDSWSCVADGLPPVAVVRAAIV